MESDRDYATSKVNPYNKTKRYETLKTSLKTSLNKVESGTSDKVTDQLTKKVRSLMKHSLTTTKELTALQAQLQTANAQKDVFGDLLGEVAELINKKQQQKIVEKLDLLHEKTNRLARFYEDKLDQYITLKFSLLSKELKT